MWNIQTYTELSSTQKLAKEKLQAGIAKHGDVYAALHQTEGTGRYSDRLWHDEFGANLLMSIVLTDIPEHLQDKMQFLAALSVLSIVRTQLSIRLSGRSAEFDTSRVRLKWTNDILIDNKKVSGVMADGIWSGDALKGIIIGIGMNINQEIFPEEIASQATSMRLYADTVIPVDSTRRLVLAMLQFSLHYYTSERLVRRLREELEWMRSLRSFSITEPDGTKFQGLRYDGISDEGSLIGLTQEGRKRIFQNASIQFS
jgi:BirA family biotin operon repressor/biotin-[acetyl-CoA-carboxylase] ligase